MDDLARLLLSHFRIEAQIPLQGEVTRVMFRLDLAALNEAARDENLDVPPGVRLWRWKTGRKKTS